MKYFKRIIKSTGLNKLARPILRFWHGGRIWRRIGIVLFAVLIFFTSINLVVAQWYIHKHRNEPLIYGSTFVPDYARYFKLDPKAVLSAMVNDLGLKQIRLVSYWKDIEPAPGKYNFSELDWQFDMAEKAGIKINLAIGLRQPRWPECHMPKWADPLPKSKWAPKLKVYMGKVIDRYKNRPSLQTYQLENEFFMKVFGICKDFDRDRLVDEYNFVKAKDPTRPVIVSRSNNWIGFPVGKPRADVVGIAVYKRVWDKSVTKRYFEYPLPSLFYSAIAGWTELVTGRNMIIHELQAEPWVPEGFDLRTASIEEQDKSMNAKRLKDRFEYAKATGMKSIDLWGAEWWYWRKVHFSDPSLWNTAKQEIQKADK